MPNPIKVGRLTLEGQRALYSHMYLPSPENSPFSQGMDFDLFDDPAMCEEIPGAGEIDRDAAFKTNFDLARHIWPAIKGLVSDGNVGSVVEDPGINAFLNAVFLRQISARSGGRRPALRQPNTYFLDLREINGERQSRHYRNFLLVNLVFYGMYNSSEDLCTSFLGSDVGLLTNPMEKLCQNTTFMFSKGAWELVNAMAMDPDHPGSYYTPKKNERREDGRLTASKMLQDLIPVLCAQCARNYDIEAMSAEALLRLVPDTPPFRFWRERGDLRLKASVPRAIVPKTAPKAMAATRASDARRAAPFNIRRVRKEKKAPARKRA